MLPILIQAGEEGRFSSLPGLARAEEGKADAANNASVRLSR